MQNDFHNRMYVIGGVFVIIMFIYMARLYNLQVSSEEYKISAENNSRRIVYNYPARGLIFDRNGELLVYNEAAYDLMVVPSEVKPFDTTSFCNFLEIDIEFVRAQIALAREYSLNKPSVFLKQIEAHKYAIFQELLYKYEGFYVQTRTLRKYPKNIAGHLLGYVGEVSPKDVRESNYYRSGDYIGVSGMERSYEMELRGSRGTSVFIVDVHNRIKGSYEGGAFDTAAVAGANLTATIESELQAYGELLMQNKTGSIVAIEPATGEILALISSPTYDPNMLVGRVRSENYERLLKDTLKPLFNRALMAKYPPGSTFKMINALIGLQEGIITTETDFPCNGGYHIGNFSLACHHGGSVGFLASIQGSCNSYYCHLFRRVLDDSKYGSVSLGYANWRRHVLSFGIGRKLDSDLIGELEGFVPDVDYYDRYYGKSRWKSLMLISMAIGQGELGVTPFQMANMTAIIANRGFYFTPHIVKAISDRDSIDARFTTKHFTTINAEYFEAVADGMELVVSSGTGTSAAFSGFTICGKTGTAENPHGEDHSIFVAFAPKHNPQIVISVYIENAGFGSTYAAPIASLMIEKFINDSISRKALEEQIINTDLIHVIPKIEN